MILRVIRGRADPAQLEALRVALDSTLGPIGSNPAGPTRHYVAARPNGDGHDVLILAFWTSAEAAMNGDARGISALSVAQAVGLPGLDAAHFELDTSVMRPGDGDVIAVRIARGDFSKPGADIEMLNLLRERVPQLGDEVIEAHVGRRIVDRTVEVTFVSAWRRLPVDPPIEALFWPDIALRYDRLTVDVYTPVGAR